jgi:uncharacterized Zn finger protein
MAKEQLPKLTEAQVRNPATAKVFERGRDYYGEGAISETIRQGMTLSGQCQGADPEPYIVRLSLDPKGSPTATVRMNFDEKIK